MQEKQRIAKRWLIFTLRIFERIDSVLVENGKREINRAFGVVFKPQLGIWKRRLQKSAASQ